MSAFEQRAVIALHDVGLQQALRRTMDNFVNGRLRALAALPHAEALRDHARVVRANTLARLDEHLLAF
ncbi:MAG: (Fe-S)-binding protein, partial [Anaerolineae bacterium]|nr:hypothetical protein [Caldilineales bacterium]MDW8268437.1 (Fe-S)-binding protein [Anaerolineae bacterium]